MIWVIIILLIQILIFVVLDIQVKERNNSNSILKFIKSKCISIDGTPIIFPAPEGMSGGPLVAFENGNYLIYGILTRWGDKLKRTMYATVVDYKHLLDNL